jgi:cyclomaltodextrinase / maltogenic alpha-amylase / neopullulanase
MLLPDRRGLLRLTRRSNRVQDAILCKEVRSGRCSARIMRLMLRTPRTPDWVKHAVFYQIFPDRFARSERVPKPTNLEPWESPPTVHGYKGGDLLGVAERLDHLQALGVSALYLNPIFQSGANHRYHTHDFLRVDPMLGGDEALRELLEACHARGMRVVLDGVFNHASRGFLQFHDVLENGAASAYLDWWHVHGFPLNAYEGTIRYGAWWNLPALPKFNTDTPAVREYIFSVAEHWLRFGIDGWRLDVPNEIDDDAFWREFRQRCLAVNPECYIVGELWDDASRWLQGDQFDAVMNYPLTRAALGFAAERLDADEIARSGLGRVPVLSAQAFATAMEAELTRYDREVVEVQLNLLGSHDTPRLLSMLNGDRAAARLAMLVPFTLPGAPCVYYGDELGLLGEHDPGCRQGMPWGREDEWDRETLHWTRDLAALRHAHPALRTGETRFVYAHHGVVAYRRTLGDDDLLVVLNKDGDYTSHIALDDLEDGARPVLLGEADAQVSGGRLRIGIAGRRGAVIAL